MALNTNSTYSLAYLLIYPYKLVAVSSISRLAGLQHSFSYPRERWPLPSPPEKSYKLQYAYFKVQLILLQSSKVSLSFTFPFSNFNNVCGSCSHGFLTTVPDFILKIWYHPGINLSLHLVISRIMYTPQLDGRGGVQGEAFRAQILIYRDALPFDILGEEVVVWYKIKTRVMSMK